MHLYGLQFSGKIALQCRLITASCKALMSNSGGNSFGSGKVAAAVQVLRVKTDARVACHAPRDAKLESHWAHEQIEAV